MDKVEIKQKVFFLDIRQKNINTLLNNFLKLAEESKDISICLKMPYKNNIDKKAIKNRFDSIVRYLRKKNVSNKQISVAFEFNNNKDIGDLKLDVVKDLELDFKRDGIKFGFLDQFNLWSMNEVENTINTVKSTANKIKQLHLSPLETLLNAYISVTKRKYKFEKEDQSFAMSRSVIGVSNNDAIVCAGYVELLKSIINKINDENIKLFRNNVLIQQNNKTIAGHTNLIAYVKDEKYHIDGYYYLDPTWDFKRDKDDYLRLNYFMVPLQNIKEIKKYDIKDVSINKKDFDINSILMSNYVKTKIKMKMSRNSDAAHLYYNTTDPMNGISFTENGLHFDNVILNNILKQEKTKNIIYNKFDEYLKDNYTKLQIDLMKMNTYLYNSTLAKFISENHDFIESLIYKSSKPIDLQTLKDALYKVLSCNVKNKDKSQIYALTERTLENNIKMSSEKFNKSAKDAFSECEYFDK